MGDFGLGTVGRRGLDLAGFPGLLLAFSVSPAGWLLLAALVLGLAPRQHQIKQFDTALVGVPSASVIAENLRLSAADLLTITFTVLTVLGALPAILARRSAIRVLSEACAASGRRVAAFAHRRSLGPPPPAAPHLPGRCIVANASRGIGRFRFHEKLSAIFHITSAFSAGLDPVWRQLAGSSAARSRPVLV